jgi:hypothetical protein
MTAADNLLIYRQLRSLWTPLLLVPYEAGDAF